jgi:hypothetical protein
VYVANDQSPHGHTQTDLGGPSPRVFNDGTAVGLSKAVATDSSCSRQPLELSLSSRRRRVSHAERSRHDRFLIRAPS